MSVLIGLEYKKSEKRAKELKTFLLELDLICDILYDKLEYSGIWESLMQLENVRIAHYIELYEHNEIIQARGKKNEEE